MKFIMSIALIFSFIAGYSQAKYDSYGEKITSENIQSASQLTTLGKTDTVALKIKANVSEVCQMKGCWMVLDAVNGIPVRVTFKDYGFFVPKDIAGRDVIVQGIVSKTTLSEEAAKHYAEDAGQAYDPQKEYVEYAFEAEGVLVSQE
jgi:hypothetical protein